MKKIRITAAFLSIVLLTVFPACSKKLTETTSSPDTSSEVQTEPESSLITETAVTETSEENIKETEAFVYHSYLDGYDSFEVTSPDLIDGVWSDVISNTHIGGNESPELSWEPVEGAQEYVIYMVDANSNGFLHWKSSGITGNSLPRGWAPKLLEYNGPHVGHGYTHVYDIYVIAIKAPADRLHGAMNAVNPRMEEFIEEVDTDIDGNSGNIIAVGKISGTFTDARFRDGIEPSGPYTM